MTAWLTVFAERTLAVGSAGNTKLETLTIVFLAPRTLALAPCPMLNCPRYFLILYFERYYFRGEGSRIFR